MFGWKRAIPNPTIGECTRDPRLIGARNLVANNVYDGEGNLVGTLDEIVIDTRTGCVRHVVLRVGGILGIGRRCVAVPWSALRPDTGRRHCIVDVPQMHLTAVPITDDDPWLQRTFAMQPDRGKASRAGSDGATAVSRG